MKFLSFFRKKAQPSIQFVPSRDFFRRLHDPRYQELAELMDAPLETVSAYRPLPARKYSSSIVTLSQS